MVNSLLFERKHTRSRESSVLHFLKLAVKQNGGHQYTKMAQKDRNAHAAVKSSFGQNECTVATMISVGGCAV